LESAPELKLEPNEEPVVGALIQEKYRLILRLAASPNHIVFRAVDETIQKEASPQPNVGRGSAILVQQRKIMAISATTL
jgi:hypothetical protein